MINKTWCRVEKYFLSRTKKKYICPVLLTPTCATEWKTSIKISQSRRRCYSTTNIIYCAKQNVINIMPINGKLIPTITNIHVLY